MKFVSFVQFWELMWDEWCKEIINQHESAKDGNHDSELGASITNIHN